MSWPGETGLGMDTSTTAHIVIGGCIGEAVVPVMIGAMMEVSEEGGLRQTGAGRLIAHDIYDDLFTTGNRCWSFTIFIIGITWCLGGCAGCHGRAG